MHTRRISRPGEDPAPRVSVVLTCFNLGSYLDEAVESVLRQTMQEFEIIIVYDGSTEEYTRSLLRDYRKPRTTVIRTENRGVSAARNLGFSKARAAFVLPLDADDLLEPACLEKTVRILEQMPEVGVASFWYRIFGTEEGEYKPGSCTLDDLLVANRLCGNSMIRASAWEAIGGYDESFRLGYEDWEFYIRMLNNGYAAHIIREFLFRYRLRRDSRNALSMRPENHVRLMDRIIEKHGDLFQKHALAVLRGKERLFSEALDYQRELREAQVWFRQRDAAHEELIGKLIEAKAWYLEQIERGKGEIARMAGEIARQGAELDHRRQTIESRDHELRSVYGSKAWKMGRAFQAAKRSLRGALLLPFRLADLGCPDGVKRRLRRILLIAPGETIKRGFCRFPYHALDRALPPSAKARIPGWLRNAARAVFGTTYVRIYRQKKWRGPLVSVVIPCYNYGRYLDDALQSVLGQTFTNLEVIIVDDGSTDPFTLEKLREIESRKNPSVRIIRQTNQKVVAARNNGIRVARGKYVCCLDADDVMQPTYLEECLSVLESGNLDVCDSYVQLFGDEYWVWETSALDPALLAKQNCVCVGAVFKKSMWEKVGGIDPSTQIGYEDWDLWMAMAEKGARGKSIPEPLYNYRKHGRSQINDFLEKHEMLYAQLRRNHPALFAGRVRPPRIRYSVVHPFINIFPERKDGGGRADAAGVLFLLPWMIVGGADVVLLGLMKSLSENRRGQVHVMTTLTTPPSMGDSAPLFRQVTPYVYRIQNFLPEELWLPFITAYIRHRGIGTVFICGCSAIYPHLPALKRSIPGLKVVDQLFNNSTLGHVANNRRFAGYIDLTFVPAEKIRKAILSEHGGDPKGIVTVYHGADTNLFDPSRIDPAEARKRFGFPHDREIILWIGRLSVEKNPHLFLELAHALRDEKGYFFVLRGNGPMIGEVRARAESLHLDNLAILDILSGEDIPYLYRLARLLVLTSRTEGVPLTLFEALAMNVPVVASDVGGIADVVRDGENGFLYREGDADGLSAATRKALATHWGDLRGLIRNRYGMRSVFQNYLRVLSAVGTPSTRD